MPSGPVRVKYNIMQPLVCVEHFEHGSIGCCPFPGCSNGTDAEEVEAAAPSLEPIIYTRAVWTAPDGAKSYSWGGDLPRWFSLSRAVWKDAARFGLISKDAAARVKTIYHYTSVEGLLGIVQSGDIWMSDYAYLNDSDELTYGLRLAKSRFQIASEKLPSAKIALQSWGSAVDQIKNRVCVSSFSSNGDSLSQWRAYGPVAIGFAVGPTMFGYANTVNLQPVIYDEKLQTGLLDLFAYYLASAYDADKSNLPADQAEQLYEDGSDRMLEFTALMKHPTFSDEREVRMIHVENPKWTLPFKRAPFRFRVSRGILQPFATSRDVVALPDTYPDQLPISEVIIGPGPHSKTLERGVRQLLNANGYNSVLIKNSTAPLRMMDR